MGIGGCDRRRQSCRGAGDVIRSSCLFCNLYPLNEATDLKEKQLKEEESDTVSVSKDNMWTRTDTAMRPGAISSGSTGPEEHDKE